MHHNGRMPIQDPHATPADIGEFGLIEALTARFPTTDAVALGPGDDAAVVTTAQPRVVVSTDVLVDGRHFRRTWSTAHHIGRKAAAQNLSDINAMGGRATALTIGLALPSDLKVAWLLELADGIAEECALVGATVVGGDITASEELVIAVTALGDVAGEPVLRSGAQPGDRLAVAGSLGAASVGMLLLSRGFRSPRALVNAHRCPEPPYVEGPRARELGATAMIDVSDGLVQDVGHLARRSGVDIDIDTAALSVPQEVTDVASAMGFDPLDHVLSGGDDYALAATFPADVELPEQWRTIGQVTAPTSGGGVTVDGSPYGGRPGHTHF